MLIRNTQETEGGGTTVVQVNLAEQFRCYDSFGPKLRRFLQEAPIDIDCEEVRKVIDLYEDDMGRRTAEAMTIASYSEMLQEVSCDYWASFSAPQQRSRRAA